MADGTNVDKLQIEIDVSAENANSAIDNLVKKLDRLQTSLGKINGSQLAGVANGVDKLGKSMQVMNTIKTADFTRLATNLTKLGSINVSALNSSASSLSHLSRAFNTLGTVSQNTQSVVNMANALSSLGGARVQRAITNIPLLATAMNNLMVTLSKSPKVSNNVIQLTNALANLTSQGAKVGTASRSIEKGLNMANNSATRTSKSFGGLASAIGKFYASYFMVIRGIKGLYKSIEGTADYLEAFNYFNVALGKIGSDWSHQFEQYGYESAEAYADSFSTRLQSSLKNLSGLQITLDADGNGLLTETGLKNLGLNIQEITQYASQLASVTNSVGQTGEVSLAAANSLTKLGADLSSLFNLDYSSVMQNLQSGLIGQSRALYKYGIDITNATLQTKAYELGLSKSVSEMTQAEKMQLRMLVILQDSKVAWGDLANTINSPSNMIRQFKNNLKEVGMVLGQLFIPLMQKVMPVINGVTIALKRLLVNIAGFLGIQLDLSSFGQGYSGLGEDVDGLTDSLDDATASAKKLKSVTLGIDELNINAPQEDSGKGTSGVGGGIDLTEEILEATSEYEKVWNDAFNNMENKAQEWANRIEKIFEPITTPLKKLFKDISIGDWFEVGQDTSNIVSGIFDLFSKAISEVDWKKLGKNIGKYLEGIDWKKVITSSIKLKFNLGKLIAEVWFSSFEVAPIETAMITAFGTMKFTGLGKIVSENLKKAIMNSALITALTKGWASLGGLGGILTTDLAIIMGAGTVTEIGLTIGTGIIGGIAAAIAGFDLGNKIGAALFAKTDEEFKAYTDFSWFGDDGFFKQAFSDLESSYDGLFKMFDYRENALVAILARVLWGPIFTVIADIVLLWNEFSEWWKNSGAKKWLEEDVAPWFTKEKWTELAMNIPIAILNKWQEFTKWWETSGVKKWFDEKVKPWLSKETWETNMSGIKTAFSNTFKNVANGVIGWLNKIISAIESLVNNAISGLDGISDIINEIPGVEIEVSAPTISLPRIPTYSLGGYDIPEDGWFRASKGEYFGRFDDGTSYIANNNQIEAGISVGVGQAVREAVSEILAPYLADIAQNTRETADKEWTTNFGDREIARANARGQKSLGYALIT